MTHFLTSPPEIPQHPPPTHWPSSPIRPKFSRAFFMWQFLRSHLVITQSLVPPSTSHCLPWWDDLYLVHAMIITFSAAQQCLPHAVNRSVSKWSLKGQKGPQMINTLFCIWSPEKRKVNSCTQGEEQGPSALVDLELLQISTYEAFAVYLVLDLASCPGRTHAPCWQRGAEDPMLCLQALAQDWTAQLWGVFFLTREPRF